MFSYVLKKKKHLKNKTFENGRSSVVSPKFVVPACVQHFFQTFFFMLPSSHILSVEKRGRPVVLLYEELVTCRSVGNQPWPTQR